MTLIEFLWDHGTKMEWRSRHVDGGVGLGTERLLRINPRSAIPYKHSPITPICHLWHHSTPTPTRNSEVTRSSPVKLGHPFYWWFVTWNLKTHFCLVNSPIPWSAYICLLIFFYHMFSLIMPLIINNFVILQPLVLFLVFLLSCFRHPLHSSTNISQVPSAHITFRCHAFTFVLTKNGWRQVLWEIALVDSFSHALSAFCWSSTKGLG